MVARIRTGKSLKGAVNYNEHKVKEGKARLLLAKGYAKSIDQLSFQDKFGRLQKLADLNTRATTHCLHVSLNFDVTESLPAKKLEAIAQSYMQQIGFGAQPFLVYEHVDAGHQHIHIVTTNIQKDGKRLSMHNLGSVQSEKARQEIEVSFGIVKANDRPTKINAPLTPVPLRQIQYGETDTKRAISTIVTQVMEQYQVGSLAEFNAVLQTYHVRADRGALGTRMYDKGGLLYHVIDERGNAIGVPIKASRIPGKPTLANLEKKFNLDRERKLLLRPVLKEKIDQSFNQSTTWYQWIERSKSLGIDVIPRRNLHGFIYGITFVDHQQKVVFNGSELGKKYSAAALQNRLVVSSPDGQHQSQRLEMALPAPIMTTQHNAAVKDRVGIQWLSPSTAMPDDVPYELKKKKRKKRKLQ